jgi:predicted nucleotidyltransferase
VQDFRNIRWAGVFGSFARETQTDWSDVDVVVSKKPRDSNVRVPLDAVQLEDELLRVWGRKVDIIYITGSELRGYVSVEALLCSRTLYGSDDDNEVLRLRNKARDILDSGLVKLMATSETIQKTQSAVSDISFEVLQLLRKRFFFSALSC